MKILVLGAVLGATLLGALPASAEMVVRAGGDGIVVRDRDHGRQYDRDRHHGWRNNYASCRTVTARRHRPDGSVVVTRRREC